MSHSVLPLAPDKPKVQSFQISDSANHGDLIPGVAPAHTMTSNVKPSKGHVIGDFVDKEVQEIEGLDVVDLQVADQECKQALLEYISKLFEIEVIDADPKDCNKSQTDNDESNTPGNCMETSDKQGLPDSSENSDAGELLTYQPGESLFMRQDKEPIQATTEIDHEAKLESGYHETSQRQESLRSRCRGDRDDPGVIEDAMCTGGHHPPPCDAVSHHMQQGDDDQQTSHLSTDGKRCGILSDLIDKPDDRLDHRDCRGGHCEDPDCNPGHNKDHDSYPGHAEDRDSHLDQNQDRCLNTSEVKDCHDDQSENEDPRLDHMSYSTEHKYDENIPNFISHPDRNSGQDQDTNSKSEIKTIQDAKKDQDTTSSYHNKHDCEDTLEVHSMAGKQLYNEANHHYTQHERYDNNFDSHPKFEWVSCPCRDHLMTGLSKLMEMICQSTLMTYTLFGVISYLCDDDFEDDDPCQPHSHQQYHSHQHVHQHQPGVRQQPQLQQPTIGQPRGRQSQKQSQQPQSLETDADLKHQQVSRDQQPVDSTTKNPQEELRQPQLDQRLPLNQPSQPEQPSRQPLLSHVRQPQTVQQPQHPPRCRQPSQPSRLEKQGKRVSMGPLKLAAMNGLSVSRASVLEPPHSDDSRAPKDERRKNLECRLEEGQVLVEFEQIPKRAGTEDCAIASRPDNKERNRFRDVYPYDRNRVRLTPTKDNPTGYVNASHVKMSVKGEQFWYIATQGPLPSTVIDFWQMMWEAKVDVVAMLTDVVEQGRQKCFQYWPLDIGPKHRSKYGDYQIQLQFVNDSGSYKTRGLQVRHIPTGEQRMICHLQYTDWPDHGCPEDVYGFLAFIDEIESVKRTIMMDQGDSKATPVMVHCSAGVGRSGVVVLTQIMKACLEHNVNVDVPTMLMQLRSQRMHLVQTVSQYSFVYKTLIQYLKNFRLI